MMDPELRQALQGERTPKFLATVSADGIPNVVPVISIEPESDSTLLFAELMIWKTKSNLLADPRVSVSVLSDDFHHWTLRGRFEGFEETGPRFEHVSSNNLFRYNAYTGPRSAGVIRIEDIVSHGSLTAVGNVCGLLAMQLTRATAFGLHKKGVTMPPQVLKKFARLKAGKCLAYTDRGGHPVAVARLGMAPMGVDRLLIGNETMSPTVYDGTLPAAACVIAFEPVAYQVKGHITRKAGIPGARAFVLEVDEVFTASPPIPGKRIA
jgi:predicted pyridoxine 5'-phosphate oxidase superfamily flavin-nucleotide-binding protein